MSVDLPAKLDRDTFLVNQRHRAWMKSKYYVYDEGGRPLFYVERPVRPLRRADITIYDDDSKATRPLLIIRQDHGYAALHRKYTLIDAASDEPIAHFDRNNVRALFRRAWVVTAADGRVLAHAREDTAALAAIRRIVEFVPYVGALMALVRTNFRLATVAADGSEAEAGAFNRKLSIADKYVLDLTSDRARLLDRRIALALAILLDTGEAR
ncbi:MAG TPA: hypothetical protein VFC53_09175 [Dehalococcoidia bacterium]|nr:hypothetical protein [Dehalococcoidia bacterium]